MLYTKLLGILFTGDTNKPVETTGKIKALVYNGEKIAEGTEKELKKVLGKIFPHAASKEAVLKYLDELTDVAKNTKLRKAALIRWLDKFEENSINHILGDVNLHN